MKMNGLIRCPWPKSELDIAYHDREWGVPLHDDRALFELLILEGAQAGLSWSTILKKRENYRAAFDNFDAKKIARYDALSKDLLKRGFKFVGSTICYAFMQAGGLVNDHLVSCFRHQELS